MAEQLTHLDARGEVHMVDVGEKPETSRRAVARGRVTVSSEAMAAVLDEKGAKGDVLAAARIAGIMAAKKTPELIPLCHSVALSKVQVEVEPVPDELEIRLTAEVHATDRTGVEMEALTAVTVAALTIYDMLKAVDRGMVIGEIELLEKSGGRSGSYRRPVRVVRKAETPPPPAEPVHQEPPSPPPLPQLPPAPEQPEPNGEAIARARRVQPIHAADGKLLACLQADPVASAYMLGDLDHPYSEHAVWFGLESNDALDAVLLLYTGLSMPTVLTAGSALDVEAILHAVHGQLPRRFYAHLREEHLRSMAVFCDLRDRKEMIRMGLSRAQYHPVADAHGVEPVTHRDTGQIMRLYQHYPDNFFEPAQLDTGLYCGIREGGELVSVAGLHVLSDKYGVAAIGNIVTHADYRGQGLATRCVRSLLDQLFPRVEHVVLNVEATNAPAIACYRKFGFRPSYRFVEAWATRRD